MPSLGRGAFLLGVPLATKVDNFQTLGAVATHTQTVPAGKRWLFYDGSVERDVNATLQITITDAADHVLVESDTEAAGTTRVQVSGLFKVLPLILDAGEKIVLTWGAGQTTPEISLVVLEVDV